LFLFVLSSESLVLIKCCEEKQRGNKTRTKRVKLRWNWILTFSSNSLNLCIWLGCYVHALNFATWHQSLWNKTVFKCTCTVIFCLRSKRTIDADSWTFRQDTLHWSHLNKRNRWSTIVEGVNLGSFARWCNNLNLFLVLFMYWILLNCSFDQKCFSLYTCLSR